jgi:endonuclease/exonuclease/phosphatase family metal-dependent hydrolase
MRLGTFNVWGLPESFSDDVSSRMREIARRLEASELDVLMIQEAWTPEVRRTIRQGARKAGFEVSKGAGASGGLMTLSRLPIRGSRFDRFRFRGDPERLTRGEYLGGKGFEIVDLEGPDGPFTLMNTHLHSRYSATDSTLDSAVRTAQLLEIIAAVHAQQGTVVVGGDFNFKADDPEFEIFRGLTGVIDLGQGLALGTVSSTNFYKRHRQGPDKRIDFIFVRPGAGVAFEARDPRLLFAETARIRQRDRSLSDHFGFRVELALDVSAVSAMPAPGETEIRIDPRAVSIARSLLAHGLVEADRREREHFRWAGGFVVAAVAAAGLQRHPSVDRRAFLRGAARATTVLALAPALGFGALARVDSDHKRDIFADARSFVADLEARYPRTHSA